MQDDFRIDSHKLIFHVERVADWLKGRNIYPLYMEIAPSGACNHRCIFCALDYLDYKPSFLNTKALKSTVRQAAHLGVKSIMYAGEGEPLLHRDICDIVRFTKDRGIDVSMTTNGVLFTKDISDKILESLSWIRVSLNAGTAKTYAEVHRTRPEDFNRVLSNLRDVVHIKGNKKLNAVIGVQLLLLPENAEEVLTLARSLKKIGIDYLTIKPYSQHPLSGHRIDSKFKYERYGHLGDKLKKLEDKNFKIIFRRETMARLSVVKDYRHCLGLPFWAYIDACGNVYACSAFLGKKEFCYGNIYRQDFKSIMNSRRRRDIVKKAALSLDVDHCREVCRLDKINSYLWELKHPGPHVNFI